MTVSAASASERCKTNPRRFKGSSGEGEIDCVSVCTCACVCSLHWWLVNSKESTKLYGGCCVCSQEKKVIDQLRRSWQTLRTLLGVARSGHHSGSNRNNTTTRTTTSGTIATSSRFWWWGRGQQSKWAATGWGCCWGHPGVEWS